MLAFTSFISCRDLSYNRLGEWDGTISTTLPSLKSIDLTGNYLYFPGSNVLNMHSLLEISGVKWSSACGDCVMIKTELLMGLNESEAYCIVDIEEYTYAEELHVQYGKSLFFVEHGFSPQCLCDEQRQSCADEEVFLPYDLGLNTLPRQLFYVEYILGAIAAILNLVVVLVSFGSSSLRKSTSFLLIGNIGFCDVIMGVYSVLIGRFTVYEFIVNVNEYPGMDTFVNVYCTVMGVIFTTAQITSVSTSLLVTIERYLSIVHCMNPEARLRKRVAVWCLAGIWCGAIAYSLLAVFRVGGLRYHGEFTCMMPFTNGPNQEDTSVAGLAVASLLVLFYLVTFALYIHIFLHVKKSQVSAGVKRKASLAKNISVMVFTNFLFFVIPMVCTLLYVYRFEYLLKAFKVDSLKDLQIYFIMLTWVPVVFLSLNSCLNPFLCAFRHPKFQQELKKHFGRCNCSCQRQSKEQFSHAWTLKSTRGLDLTLTDTVAGSEVVCERYQSLDTLL